MAHFWEKGWLLPIILMITLPATQAGLPIIRVMGKGQPLKTGGSVTLECLTDKLGEDLSGFTFQKFSPWLGSWLSLDNTEQLRCWYYDVNINREDGHLLLTISNLQSWHNGLYRCISADLTSKPSEELDLNIPS